MGHSNGIFGYFAGERLGLYALIGCACILLAMILGDLLLPAFYAYPDEIILFN